MSNTFDATVPEGLTELLEEFAIAVLKDRPKDLVQFAAHYFQNLHMSRKQIESGSGVGGEHAVGMDVENGQYIHALVYARVRRAESVKGSVLNFLPNYAIEPQSKQCPRATFVS
jgi:hypothetical protein